MIVDWQFSLSYVLPTSSHYWCFNPYLSLSLSLSLLFSLSFLLLLLQTKRKSVTSVKSEENGPLKPPDIPAPVRQRPPEPAALQKVVTLDDFKFLKVLGKGSFGKVSPIIIIIIIMSRDFHVTCRCCWRR